MDKKRIDELMNIYRNANYMGYTRGWFEQTMFAMDGYRKLYAALDTADITEEDKAAYKTKIKEVKGVF